jgi:hypothetical protein
MSNTCQPASLPANQPASLQPAQASEHQVYLKRVQQVLRLPE